VTAVQAGAGDKSGWVALRSDLGATADRRRTPRAIGAYRHLYDDVESLSGLGQTNSRTLADLRGVFRRVSLRQSRC